MSDAVGTWARASKQQLKPYPHFYTNPDNMNVNGFGSTMSQMSLACNCEFRRLLIDNLIGNILQIIHRRVEQQVEVDCRPNKIQNQAWLYKKEERLDRWFRTFLIPDNSICFWKVIFWVLSALIFFIRTKTCRRATKRHVAGFWTSSIPGPLVQTEFVLPNGVISHLIFQGSTEPGEDRGRRRGHSQRRFLLPADHCCICGYHGAIMCEWT